MKILMQNRPDPFITKGGETVQMLQTKKHLEKLGHIVDISTELEPDLGNYDIVHLFNLTMVGHTYIQAINAKKWGKPTVLSTIYFNWDEFEKKGREGILKILNRLFSIDSRERLKAIARTILSPSDFRIYFRQIQMGYISQQRGLLDIVDAILPNSLMEQESIYKDFFPQMPVSQVVPNATDYSYGEGSADIFYKKYGFRDFVLCVARIDNRKNQLALIEALESTGLTVVFIGGNSPNHKNYFTKFKKIIDKSKQLIYFAEMNSEDLAHAYKAAAVHVLPSWLETPGLVSLEAALAGCKIVTTNRGSTTEYFKEYAWYCDPTDTESIRKAVLDAIASPKNLDLITHIRENYNWERAAELTLQGYHKAIKHFEESKRK